MGVVNREVWCVPSLSVSRMLRRLPAAMSPLLPRLRRRAALRGATASRGARLDTFNESPSSSPVRLARQD